MIPLSSTNKKDSRAKYIYIITTLTIFVLWTTTYEYKIPFVSASISSNILQQNYKLTPTRRPICTVDDYNKGKWVYDPIPQLNESFTATEFTRATGYHCMKKFAHRCFRRGGNELMRAKAIVDYRWKPDDCELLKLDTQKLAEHFVKHPILFVGDSITQLQFESLGCLLGYELPNRYPIAKGMSHFNGGNSKIRVDERAPANSNKTAMAYIRSDYLIRLDDFKMISPFESVGTQLGSGENYPWVHALSGFDYIIINTGPHWHPNLHWGPNQSELELLTAFKGAMSAVFDYLKRHTKQHQRVWIRTTPYGHATCSQFKEPQQNPIAPSRQPGEYEWHLFQKFDLIWKELLLHEQDDSRFGVFDISVMSNQRGDAHSKPDRDCLHTCIPGPVDDWNRLLYSEIMKEII